MATLSLLSWCTQIGKKQFDQATCLYICTTDKAIKHTDTSHYSIQCMCTLYTYSVVHQTINPQKNIASKYVAPSVFATKSFKIIYLSRLVYFPIVISFCYSGQKLIILNIIEVERHGGEGQPFLDSFYLQPVGKLVPGPI